MNRKILGLLASLALAAGCEFAKKTTYEGPIDQCRSAGGACTENAECCSYGCTAGVCVPGDHVGTVCRTTDDCGYPDLVSFTQMTCKSGSCAGTTATTCRDDTDVCTSSTQCCGHHCSAAVGGRCVPNKIPVITVNGAVQTVPRNQPWAMSQSASASDPDTGETATLVYGWTITPVNPPSATGWSFPVTTGPSPTFTPGSTLATYLVSLTVTDTWGATATASFNLDVVNTPPVVTPAPATTVRRNIPPGTVTMTVYDENADNVTCTWSGCRVGSTTECSLGSAFPTVAAFVAPTSLANAASYTATLPTNLQGADEGDWNVILSCNDPSSTSFGTTTVTVVNDPPNLTVPASRTFNLGFSLATTPVANVSATATDPNGDVIDSWTWTITPPAGKGSAVGNGSLGVTNSGVGTLSSSSVAGFTPDVTGDYTLTVTACDPAVSSAYFTRAGGCTTKTIVATVYPYVRPLGNVVDAAWRKSDDRLIMVGTDTLSRLWIVDPAVDPAVTPEPFTNLGAIPVALSVKTDGTEAIVGETASHWQTVALGATPAASTLWTGPFTPTAVAHHGNRGFAISGLQNPPVYQLNTSTGTYGVVACQTSGGAVCTPTGDRMVSDATDLWILDAGSNISRYAVNNGNGDLTRLASVAVSYSATDLWRSSDPTYLFLAGTNGVKNATTLANVGTLPTGATQADSSLTLASIVGLAATGATVTTFGSSFELGPQTSHALPHWGTSGADRTLTARYAFVSADGTKAHVVVQSSAPAAWGLYSCALTTGTGLPPCTP